MKRALFLAAAMAALLIVAGAAFSAELKVMTEDELGRYLADSEGMTLYYFKKDSPGESACSGRCLENWPVFYDKDLSAPPGLDGSEFGAITRADGKKQSTFRGYPLYYFAGDRKPGERRGHNLGNVWSVIHPGKFKK